MKTQRNHNERRSIMSAYIVFTRTKTLDQKELEAYWAGIKDTMKGHPIDSPGGLWES